MREKKSENQILSIAIERLVPHPDRSNRMSQKKFAKLVRNIERTGRYEPLIIRPCPNKTGMFQIINGHNRWKALLRLGYPTVEVVVWDVDDQETDILLATLNRLGGSDDLDKRLALMSRLHLRLPTSDLAKLLPHTAKQIHRMNEMHSGLVPRIKPSRPALAHPVVFFLNDVQKDIVEQALSNARETRIEKTRAARNAAALTTIAQRFNVKS